MFIIDIGNLRFKGLICYYFCSTALFLPGLSPPEMCEKNGQLNPPICVAWSSAARNHFIPLVPVKDSK